MSETTQVSSVSTATMSMPLPRPLQLGAMTVARREYSAVQVTSVDGLIGQSYALSREAPMAEIIERLISPHVLDQNSDFPEAVWERAFRGSAIVGRVGLVRRALGMVDVALWDIAGQRAGKPVWQLLGSTPNPLPCMLVAAYLLPGKSIPVIVEEVVTQAREGWPLVKISRSPDNRFMRELLAELRKQLPEKTGLVVDVGFGWRNSDEAIADLREWGDLDLAWLEDPLLPEDVEGCAKIRRKTGLPVGVGDEVTDPRVLRSLVENHAVDVLRVDVIAIGGITAARRIIDWATAKGVAVSCHVYPEVSVHLGVGIETFGRSAEGNPYDPAPTLIEGGPSFDSGWATPPTVPGTGFTLKQGIFEFDRG